MGVGGEKKAMHEISSTKASLQDEAFEAILEKVKAAGADISKDESSPLYTDVGMEEFEIGTERVIEFNLNDKDFQLTRKVETHILQGAARQKHVEELDTPRSRMTLKVKAPNEDIWQAVDLEDMF